ncbi:MAG TPA: hypothetical protein VJA26_11445 [Gammaproteobacteria bacterium]|nr:hypothetical protein [Gammaproteobacteria bacterium]
MKTFKSLTLAGLLLAAVARASAGEPPGIEVIVVTAKYAEPVGIEEIVVTAKYPVSLTVEKLRPVVPVQLPTLNLQITGTPEA